MQLKEFLTRYQTDKKVLEEQTVICFAIPEKSIMPVIFSSHCISLFKSDQLHIESLDVSTISYSQVVSQLETSFLGMGLCYWLKGIDDIDLKYRTLLLDFLARYQGPHKVIIFMQNKDAYKLEQKNLVITLVSKVDSSLFATMLNFFKKKFSSSVTKLITQISSSHDAIDLDQACMIINYVQVMGRWDQPAQKLLEKILESEHSLFILSQYFFAKDSSAFFTLWSRFESEYPMTFWTTFWSEQLWRAYHVHYFLKNNNNPQAKTVGFRLPFTFMQRDWKKTTLFELKNAHQSIYQLDLAFKNNIETQAGIDLFYSKFFLNEFC